MNRPWTPGRRPDRRRHLGTVAVLVAALSLAVAPPALAGTDEEKAEHDVVTLVNKERATAGCSTLTVDPRLTTAARRHSQDLADHDGPLGHTGSDGTGPGDRITAAGYAWAQSAENAHHYPPNANAAMYGWANGGGIGWFTEPPDANGRRGHHDAIVNCSYTQTGVGVVKAADGTLWWTQVFASPEDPSAGTEPPS